MQTLTLPYAPSPTGTPLPASVHYSPGGPPKPIILLLHAGGFASGSPAMIPPAQIAHLAAARGAVVACPAYRLCPTTTLGGGPVADARAGLPAALAERGVRADGRRVGVVGYSAGGMLALELGNEPDPPSAILDFYGVKYLDEAFWARPFAGFAGVPDAPRELVMRVYEDEEAPTEAPPMFVDGKPDLKTPRSAWMIGAIKRGWLYRACIAGPESKSWGWGEGSGSVGEVRAEDVAAVEATRGFAGKAEGKKWPPTCFVHGTADVFAPFELAERAEKELREAGGEVKLIKVEGAAHVFDMALKEGDALFEGPVVEALDWLIGKI
ncbi:putative polyketide synthase [Neofusicoccum parvum]|nr:putative polyketide synthase [Neofusicoccum parvum]